jgi:hypothetical protein
MWLLWLSNPRRIRASTTDRTALKDLGRMTVTPLMIRGLILINALILGVLFSASGSKAVGTTPGLTLQESEFTEANWLSHPKIKAIRGMVKTTRSRLKRKSFKVSERKFESCQDQFFTLRQIARDSKGVAAWYRQYFEYEDGSYDFQYYYDLGGRLRFVFAVTFAANGTRQQHRIYFDETGKRIWEVTRFLKGPGCPGCFPIPYPDEALAHDAAKAFANDEGCKEMEPQPKRGTRKAKVATDARDSRNGT